MSIFEDDEERQTAFQDPNWLLHGRPAAEDCPEDYSEEERQVALGYATEFVQGNLPPYKCQGCGKEGRLSAHLPGCTVAAAFNMQQADTDDEEIIADAVKNVVEPPKLKVTFEPASVHTELQEKLLNVLSEEDALLVEEALWTASDQWWDASRDEATAMSDHEEDRQAALWCLRKAKAAEDLLIRLGYSFESKSNS